MAKSVGIATTKEVPLYYYRGTLHKFKNGEWGNQWEFFFKSIKTMAELSDDEIAKALDLNYWKDDCLYWEPVKVEAFFSDMKEV